MHCSRRMLAQIIRIIQVGNMKAILVKTDGTVTPVQPKNGTQFSLEEMYSLIGCGTVEHIELAKGVHMWIDENGKLTGEAFNKLATDYFHKSEYFKPELYRKAGLPVDYVVGNVILEDRTKAGNYIEL